MIVYCSVEPPAEDKLIDWYITSTKEGIFSPIGGLFVCLFVIFVMPQKNSELILVKLVGRVVPGP